MIVVLEMGLNNTNPAPIEAITKYPEVLFYGFEPRLSVRKQFEDYRFSNFVFVPKAVWNKNEWHIMHIGGGNECASSLTTDRGCKYFPPITVECIDFDEWVRKNLDKNDYNVMRCDISGSEFIVLAHLIEKGSIDYFKEIYVKWYRRKFNGASPYRQRITAYCGANDINLMDWVEFSIDKLNQGVVAKSAKTPKLKRTADVYPPAWGSHLGDCMASLNYLIHEAFDLNQRIVISDHYFKGTARKRCVNLYDIEKAMADREWFTIVPTSGTRTRDQYDYLNFYEKHRNKPFIKNKYQWDKNNVGSNLIAYQFDGRNPRAALKNFPSQEIQDATIKAIEDMGFKMVKLGWPMTLEQSSKILSEVEFFIGVMSGMGWLAASTRTPTFYLGNRFPPKIALGHMGGYQTFIFSQTHVSLVKNIRRYKEDRTYYEKNCVPLTYKPDFSCWAIDWTLDAE